MFKKPISLHPLEPRHRIALWGSVLLCVSVLLFLWYWINIRSLPSEWIEARYSFSSSMDQSVRTFQGIAAQSSEWREIIEERLRLFQEAYAAHDSQK